MQKLEQFESVNLKHLIKPQKPIAIISAEFNYEITKNLVRGIQEAFLEFSIPKQLQKFYWVPGSFEIPGFTKHLITKHDFSSVICVGAIIKGDTAHFEYVANETTRGLMDLSLSSHIPIINSVLTTFNTEQAEIRSQPSSKTNVGYQCAKTALIMSSQYK